MSKADSRTPMPRPGTSARMPSTISRRKRVRPSSDPPYLPGRGHAAQELVTEVAVAVLDVDERETRRLGTARRDEKVADQSIELVIGEHRAVVANADARIEHGMAIRDARARRRARSDAKSARSA